MNRQIKTDFITGEKIMLRPMTEEDTELIVTWRNREFVRKNFIYQEPFTAKGHQNWIESMINTGMVIQYIICEKATLCPIGSVYLRDINRTHKKAEYGIFIGEEDALNRGYGTEAARLVLGVAFKALGLHKVVLRLFADNLSAKRSYEKAGFRQEACLRDEVLIQGEYRDMILMGVLAEDGED